MIPTTKCCQCKFQDENKVCQNMRCLSYKERVLDGYIACYMFDYRKSEITKMHDELKPGRCETCLVKENCRLSPETCPGTLDKTMSEILMNDDSPMGSLFKKLVEDIMAAGARKF